MRSTNIIIFLICLNAAAAVVGAGLGGQLGVEPTVGGGPNMFINLGAPSILIDPFKVVLIFVFGFDVAEVLSGRILS